MKSPTRYFGVVLTAAMAAGCSGGPTGSTTPFVPASASTQSAATVSNNSTVPCKTRGGCKAHLMVPLSFDGKTLKIARFGSCKGIGSGSAPAFTSTKGRQFFLARSVTISASCADEATASSLLFIAVSPKSKAATLPFAPVAGPVRPSDSTWTFAPVATGVAMKANEKFVFFVVAVPNDETSGDPSTPPPGPVTTPEPPQSYQAVAPLNFDGTNFTVATMAACDAFGAPNAYTATATAPLSLASPVVIAPTCVPSPSPSPSASPNQDGGGSGDGGGNVSGPLYIVATIANFDGGSGDEIHANDHGGTVVGSINGIAIAGPANLTDNPWSFTPLAPGLTLTQGLQYQFYVATPHGDGGSDWRPR